MPERVLTCPHCRREFVGFHTRKYCSIKCAVDSRILIRGDNECWPWQGSTFAKDGYGRIVFSTFAKDGYGRIVFLDIDADAHHVAYKIYVGEVPEGFVVRHSCDNPICCNYRTHLLVGTQLENRRDAVERNRVCHGVNHHSAKLTPNQVDRIRTLHSEGNSLRVLGRQFACSDTSILRIIQGRNWRRA
jgi:hypothetical protein